MNAQKFVKENNLQNIEIEIGGKKESMLSILERFQQPITDACLQLENKASSTQRLMDTNPMSPMTEMEYKRIIVQCIKTKKILKLL
jgi:hypothetical protein